MSLPPSLPKQREVCTPWAGTRPRRGDNSLSPSNRASPGMGAGDKRLGGSSCVNISLDSARSLTATTEATSKGSAVPTECSLFGVGMGWHIARTQPGAFLPQQRPRHAGLATSELLKTQVLALAHLVSVLVGTRQRGMSKARHSKEGAGKTGESPRDKHVPATGNWLRV